MLCKRFTAKEKLLNLMEKEQGILAVYFYDLGCSSTWRGGKYSAHVEQEKGLQIQAKWKSPRKCRWDLLLKHSLTQLDWIAFSL